MDIFQNLQPTLGGKLTTVPESQSLYPFCWSIYAFIRKWLVYLFMIFVLPFVTDDKSKSEEGVGKIGKVVCLISILFMMLT